MMMLFKAFFIFLVLCSLIIQPSMTARDPAHDTQTRVDVQRSVDATITYPVVKVKPSPPPPPPSPPPPPHRCKKYYRNCYPPTP